MLFILILISFAHQECFHQTNPFVSFSSIVLSIFLKTNFTLLNDLKIFLNKLTYEENKFVCIKHSINVTGWKIKFEWQVTFNATHEAWNENLWECFVMTCIIIRTSHKDFYDDGKYLALFVALLLWKRILNWMAWMNLHWILFVDCFITCKVCVWIDACYYFQFNWDNSVT